MDTERSFYVEQPRLWVATAGAVCLTQVAAGQGRKEPGSLSWVQANPPRTVLLPKPVER